MILCWTVLLIQSLYSLCSFSMKRQSRLSLRRRKSCSEAQDVYNDPIEISDDESNVSSNIQTSTKKCTVTSHEAVNVPNSTIDASECNLKHAHDISDDLSSDDEVIVVDNVCNSDFNKKPSMFNWNKTTFATNQLYQNIFPESSGSSEVMSVEAPNKRQKIMNDSSSADSSFGDELTSLDTPKDDSPSKVGIQHSIMIAGIKVNFPLKPYPCQIAVMNSVSNMIV